jgi:hypothetical protein
MDDKVINETEHFSCFASPLQRLDKLSSMNQAWIACAKPSPPGQNKAAKKRAPLRDDSTSMVLASESAFPETTSTR